MNVFLYIPFRVVHIIAGLLWAGAAVTYLFFVEPAARSSGPAGHKFLSNLAGKHRYPMYMGLVSTATILSGLPLFWSRMANHGSAWILSGPGLALSLGSVITVAVFILGITQLSPRGARLAGLGKEIESGGGAPSAAQLAELQRLDREMTGFERWDVALLTVALLTMVTARFWP